MDLARYRLRTSFVLGYHGCDAASAEKILSDNQFKQSTNDYDWLGHGVYFWESDPKRGLDFAKQQASRLSGPKVENPVVVGAVLDLRACLDLSTLAGTQLVAEAYHTAMEMFETAKGPIPKNSPDKDSLVRRLDCAVLNILHDIQSKNKFPEFDSVRGIFVEGSEIFPGSAIREKTHTQLCVRNSECILGVFRVPSRFVD